MNLHDSRVRPPWQWLQKPSTEALACPKCNGPLQWSAKEQLWLLLIVPFVVSVVVSLSTWPLSGLVLVATAILALFGIVMALFKANLERSPTRAS